jgi:hypothetical protein
MVARQPRARPQMALKGDMHPGFGPTGAMMRRFTLRRTEPPVAALQTGFRLLRSPIAKPMLAHRWLIRPVICGSFF